MSPIFVLLLQAIVIVAAARSVGAAFRRFGQPAVVGEMVGSARGLGWYVMHTSGVYDITGSITALVVLMLLAMVFNGVLAWVERRMLHWRRGAESWTGQ